MTFVGTHVPPQSQVGFTAAFSGNQNNFVPGGDSAAWRRASVVSLNGSGAPSLDITGFEAPSGIDAALIKTIINVSGSNKAYALQPENGSSSAANRIKVAGAGGRPQAMYPHAIVTLYYDLSIQRWRVIGNTDVMAAFGDGSHTILARNNDIIQGVSVGVGYLAGVPRDGDENIQGMNGNPTANAMWAHENVQSGADLEVPESTTYGLDTVCLLDQASATMRWNLGLLRGARGKVVIQQDDTGGRLIGTYKVGASSQGIIKFPGGVEPTLSTGQDDIDVLEWYCVDRPSEYPTIHAWMSHQDFVAV